MGTTASSAAGAGAGGAGGKSPRSRSRLRPAPAAGAGAGAGAAAARGASPAASGKARGVAKSPAPIATGDVRANAPTSTPSPKRRGKARKSRPGSPPPSPVQPSPQDQDQDQDQDRQQHPKTSPIQVSKKQVDGGPHDKPPEPIPMSPTMRAQSSEDASSVDTSESPRSASIRKKKSTSGLLQRKLSRKRVESAAGAAGAEDSDGELEVHHGTRNSVGLPDLEALSPSHLIEGAQRIISSTTSAALEGMTTVRTSLQKNLTGQQQQGGGFDLSHGLTGLSDKDDSGDDLGIGKSASFTSRKGGYSVLPRGGYLTNTQACGAIQFGIPPETIKDALARGLEVPRNFVILGDMFDRKVGLSKAEFEFPIYFNFFIKRKRVNIITTTALMERIKAALRETLIGPGTDANVREDYPPDTPEDCLPNFLAEGEALDHTRPSFKLEDVVQFTIFDPVIGCTLGDGAVSIRPRSLNSKNGTSRLRYEVRENDSFVALVPSTFRLPGPVFGTGEALAAAAAAAEHLDNPGAPRPSALSVGSTPASWYVSASPSAAGGLTMGGANGI